MLKEGDLAPAFDLLADDGKRYSLESMSGKRFVLYFYPKDDTSGCTTEACEFTGLEGFGMMDVPVLGVSPDSVESHAKFREKYALGVTLLSDTDRKAAIAYGAWGEKKNYGKTYAGIIRSTFVVGPDGKIEKCYTVRKAAWARSEGPRRRQGARHRGAFSPEKARSTKESSSGSSSSLPT